MTGSFNKISGQLLALSLILALLNCCTKIELADGNEDWSFIVFSDVQQGYGVYGQLAQHIGNINPTPRAVICCGDIMLRSANEVEWLNFWHISKPITSKVPIILARGNHEGNDKFSEQMLMQQYSFSQNIFYFAQEINNTCFVILDTEIKYEEGFIGTDQFLWLEDILENSTQNQSIDHIFIFMHRPMFTQGKYMNSPLSNSDNLHQLFLKYPKIKGVFSGHEHMFHKNRKDGLTYITTGGGGGILYHGYGGDYHHFTKISFFEHDDRINIKTIGLFNEVVEDFDL